MIGWRCEQSGCVCVLFQEKHLYIYIYLYRKETRKETPSAITYFFSLSLCACVLLSLVLFLSCVHARTHACMHHWMECFVTNRICSDNKSPHHKYRHRSITIILNRPWYEHTIFFATIFISFVPLWLCLTLSLLFLVPCASLGFRASFPLYISLSDIGKTTTRTIQIKTKLFETKSETG